MGYISWVDSSRGHKRVLASGVKIPSDLGVIVTALRGKKMDKIRNKRRSNGALGE
jgi:hypothetical protein